MKLIRFSFLEEPLDISNPDIYDIRLECTEQFRKAVFLIKNEEEKMEFSINYIPKDAYKCSYSLFSIFDVDLNEKKLLNAFYKRQLLQLNSSTEDKIRKINSDILAILDDFSMNAGALLEYNLELDFSKILALYNFSFKEIENKSFLELFIQYIKFKMEFQDIEFIIMISMLRYFTSAEIELLKKELALLKISLINVDLLNIKEKNDSINICIDMDYCVI